MGIASNYSITYTADSGQLTVNQLGLTISGLTASKDYDGSITIGGTASLNTPVSGDNVSLNAASASASFDNTNVGTTTVTFSGYALSGSDSANYSLTQPSITTGVITPAPLTITADNQTQIYGFGGTSAALGTSAFTFSGLCPGDSVSSVTLSTNASLSGSSNYNVGTWTLTPIAVHFLIGSSSNYTITYVNASTGLTITPAPLTITASESQTYGFGGTSAALGTTAFTASGLFGSDSVTSVTLTTNATLSSSSNYNAGTWDIAPSAAIGSGLSNYTITYDENSTGLTVAAKALTLTALDQNRSYGDVNPALTYTITGLVPGDFLDSSELTGSPDIQTTAVDYTSGAGVYHITIHDLGNLKYTDPNSNYTFQNALFVNGMLTIQPAPLTITAVNVTRVYGQSNPALTPQYSGFVNGETVTTSDLTGSPSLSTAATTASAAGTYSIVVGTGSLASTDYTLSYEPGTLTVTPAVLTVATVDVSRAYGAANPTLSCNITGFISGETLLNSDLTGTPGVSSAATPASPVGSYAVTPALGTLKSNNYTFAFQAGTLTVTPAVLTVAAVDVSRAYGVANPTLTYTITGFANGETAATGGVTGTPALSTTADANSSVGTYTIAVGSGTLNATNYSFQSSGPGTLTITPALLIVQPQNLQRSYGTTNPPLAYTLVREDQPQAVVSALASGASGAPALSTSAVASSPVGSYAITVSPGTLAVASPNYALDFSHSANGELTIGQATLVITANPASRAYGAADPTFTDTISGFINGQTLATSGVTGAPSFTTTADSTSHVGTYNVVAGIGSLQSGDYLFSFVPNTLTITPVPLTIEANATSQPFGTTPSLSASYIGLVSGDTAASLTTPAVLSTTATAATLPGTYPIAVSGASSADYSITYKNGTFTVQQSPTFSSLEGPILRSTVTPPVTFTVDVSSYSEGSVPLTGVVEFYAQAQMIGAVPVVNGIATLTTSALAEGNYMVYAVYQGDTNYEPSSTGTIAQMVMSTAPAVPVKRAAPTPAHPKKTTPKPTKKTTPKPKAPAPKPKAHPVIKPKALPATKPRAAVPVKTHVKPAVVRTKR